jgi:hypothetical protein
VGTSGAGVVGESMQQTVKTGIGWAHQFSSVASVPVLPARLSGKHLHSPAGVQWVTAAGSPNPRCTPQPRETALVLRLFCACFTLASAPENCGLGGQPGDQLGTKQSPKHGVDQAQPQGAWSVTAPARCGRLRPARCGRRRCGCGSTRSSPRPRCSGPRGARRSGAGPRRAPGLRRTWGCRRRVR